MVSTIAGVPRSNAENSHSRRTGGVRVARHNIKSALPKLHVHLLQRLKDFSGGEVSEIPGPTVRTQSEDSASSTDTKKPEAKPSKQKKKEEFVAIGKAKIRKAEVTKIGDLDSNGYEDYIVASPKTNNRAGSIRLYLMAEKDQFLYSRELVPGHWGFSGPPLESGDAFGSAILKLPNSGKGSPCVLAIGAPGDTSSTPRHGKVYIIKISDRGNVLSAKAITAISEPALSKQHESDEGFGSEIKAIGDLNGDGQFELSVKSLSGSTTMLFLDDKAELKTALKIHDIEKGSTDGKANSKNWIQLPSSGLDLGSLRIRAGISNQCFFNETNCACSLKPVQEYSALCLDVIGSEKTTGKTLCKPRDCQTSYSCSCDGTKMCERVKIKKNSYTRDAPAADGNVYCSKESIEVEKNIVLDGAPLPTPELSPELTPYNATHCRCSLKKDVMGTSQCLDYLKTIYDVALLCTSRQCVIRDDDYACDGIGQSYCSRSFSENVAYVNDGKTPEEGVAYCHRETHTIETLRRLY